MSVVLVLMLAVGVAPVPAGRQRANDADMPPVKADEANRTMQMFSDCIVGTSGATVKAVDAFLRLPSDSPPSHAAGIALAQGDCMPRSFLRTRMRLQSPLLRASLYDARYRRQFGKRPVDISGIAQLSVAREFDGTPSTFDTYGRVLGDCVARKDPVVARALAMSRASSKAENAAIAALRPALGNCVQKDNMIRLSRPMLRGMVGEALYKLSLAASPAGNRVAGTKN